MNKANKKGNKVYIVLAIILIIAVGVIMLLLNMTKSVEKKPLTEEPKTTTTTTKIAEKPVEPVVAKNFEASLSMIADGGLYINDYKEEKVYSGVTFNFNCTKFDEEKYTCLSGSALMNVNNILIPLYTYESDSNNYLLHPEDYYIILNDDYIILIMNEKKATSGIAKFYNREGKYLFKIDNVLMSYKLGNKIDDKMYPNVQDNTFTFYECNKNKVYVTSAILPKYTELKQVETINEAICD